jgi:hypothetical protein
MRSRPSGDLYAARRAIAEVTAFIGEDVLPRFGLPPELT